MERWRLDDFLLDCDDAESFKQEWFPEFCTDDGLEDGNSDDSDKDDVRAGWYDKHQPRWWRLDEEMRKHAVDAVKDNAWSHHMPLRMRDLMALRYGKSSEESAPGARTLEQIWDLAQNAGRVPTGRGTAPCSLPHGRPWLMHRRRPLSGVEGLLLQGADPRFFPALRPGIWPNSFIQDLSGNGCCGPVGVAWLVAVVSGLPSSSYW